MKKRYGLKCPVCKYPANVLRKYSTSNQFRRRRQCLSCGERFWTREKLVEEQERLSSKEKVKRLEIGYLIGGILEDEMEGKQFITDNSILKVYSYLKDNDFRIRTYDEISSKTMTHHNTVVRVCHLLHKMGILADPLSEAKKLKMRGSPRKPSGKLRRVNIKRLSKSAKERVDYFKKFGTEGKLRI